MEFNQKPFMSLAYDPATDQLVMEYNSVGPVIEPSTPITMEDLFGKEALEMEWAVVETPEGRLKYARKRPDGSMEVVG